MSKQTYELGVRVACAQKMTKSADWDNVASVLKGNAVGGLLGLPAGIVPGALLGLTYGADRELDEDESRLLAILQGLGKGIGYGGIGGAALGGLAGGIYGQIPGNKLELVPA